MFELLPVYPLNSLISFQRKVDRQTWIQILGNHLKTLLSIQLQGLTKDTFRKRLILEEKTVSAAVFRFKSK